MSIRYRQFKSSDREIIAGFIKDFYKGGPGVKEISDKKIKKTFSALVADASKGKILVIEKGKIIIGYAILVNFWSNEWGGNILFLDEIYLKPEFRGQGIGRNFINYLIKKRYNHSTAIQLEVSPTNKKAKALYESIGFRPCRNRYFLYDFFDS